MDFGKRMCSHPPETWDSSTTGASKEHIWNHFQQHLEDVVSCSETQLFNYSISFATVRLSGAISSPPALGAPCPTGHLWWHSSISFTFSPALRVSSTGKQPWQVHCHSKRSEMRRKSFYTLKEPGTTLTESQQVSWKGPTRIIKPNS